jgi:hypothetical protein
MGGAPEEHVELIALWVEGEIRFGHFGVPAQPIGGPHPAKMQVEIAVKLLPFYF